MRKLIATILLYSITIHLFYSSGYLFDYYVNSEFYLENCENRDRPELNCDGQCILAKKLAQSQQESGEEWATIPANIEYIGTDFVADLTNEFVLTSQTHGWLNLYEFSNLNRPLHPPQS